MSNANSFTPEEAEFAIENHAGSKVQLASDISSGGFSSEFETDTSNVLASDTETSTIGHLDNGSISMGGPYKRGRAILMMQHWGAPGRKSFETDYKPGGTGEDLPQHTFDVLQSSIECQSGDGTASLSADYQITGDIVTTTQT